MESKNIISIMRTFPDKFSKEKRVPLELVKKVAPEIGLNSKLSVRKTISIIRDRRFHDEIKNVLSENSQIELFPNGFLTLILTNMDQREINIDPYSGRKRNIYNHLISLLPLWFKYCRLSGHGRFGRLCRNASPCNFCAKEPLFVF